MDAGVQLAIESVQLRKACFSEESGTLVITTRRGSEGPKGGYAIFACSP